MIHMGWDSGLMIAQYSFKHESKGLSRYDSLRLMLERNGAWVTLHPGPVDKLKQIVTYSFMCYPKKKYSYSSCDLS